MLGNIYGHYIETVYVLSGRNKYNIFWKEQTNRVLGFRWAENVSDF